MSRAFRRGTRSILRAHSKPVRPRTLSQPHRRDLANDFPEYRTRRARRPVGKLRAGRVARLLGESEDVATNWTCRSGASVTRSYGMAAALCMRPDRAALRLARGRR